MDSHSKIPLSAAQVENIVARHFNSGVRLAAYQELREGFFNTAALLELSDGRKLVLKAAPPLDVRVMRYEKNLMKAEVESMRLVRQKTNVPVPEILVYDTTKTLLPSDFFFMEFIPGVPFHKLRKELTPENQCKVEIQMGRMCRQIAEIIGPVFGYWEQPEPAGGHVGATCFEHMLEGILLDAQDCRSTWINLTLRFTKSSASISTCWMKSRRRAWSIGICGMEMCLSTRKPCRSPV